MSNLPPREHIPATPGDALLRTNPISQELADLLAPRVMRTTYRSRGCWVREEGYRKSNGYSYITRKSADGVTTHYLAHRVVYVHYFGEIQTGYTIDHLCENPPCVKPEHLEAVTHRQNVLRSQTNPYAINARRTRERERGEVA